MLRRYILLVNFCLILASLFLVNRIYEVWKPKAKQSEASQGLKGMRTNVPTLKISDTRKNPRPAYQVIVDKDLFRPERTEWKPDVEAQKVAAAPSPKLKIFGIVISGGFKHAWIEEEGKGGKLKRISEGEQISGWKVNSIEFSSLSLVNGNRTENYRLIEPGKPKQRVVPKQLTTPPQASAGQQQKPLPPQQLPPPQQRPNPLQQPKSPNQ
jgi:hypothetical protein